MEPINKLVVLGNGFDLAHGLKTTYRNFIDWYVCDAFKQFNESKQYSDALIKIESKYSNMASMFQQIPVTFEEALELISSNQYQTITYSSSFFNRLLTTFKANNWVDIERDYFKVLKAHFKNSSPSNKREILKLNAEFDHIIAKLTDYIKIVNQSLAQTTRLKFDHSRCHLRDLFADNHKSSKTIYLNFNYTDTLQAKDYANEEAIIHIHGRVIDIERNPIIFGYGDESDPDYQQIEDSGQNIYLEHIKSFGYFRTDNYHKLLAYLDSEPYKVSIVGHSCGLSDRVLLNQIFEHPNCRRIEIFYHQRSNGTDNFKEITQEISRHFKPQNKDLMRRRVGHKNSKNIIPQN